MSHREPLKIRLFSEQKHTSQIRDHELKTIIEVDLEI